MMLLHDLPSAVFHVADASSWPSIQQLGLLTTASLLRRWEEDPAVADTLLTRVRRHPHEMEHPDCGTAWIRDQARMTEAALEGALDDGLSVSDWCLLLNSQVYFFPSRTAAQTLLKAYAPRPQVMVALRTTSLVREYGDLFRLAGMNAGSTSRVPKRRGRGTFSSVSGYAGTSSTIKEVAVRADILDLPEHLLGAWRHEDGKDPVPLS